MQSPSNVNEATEQFEQAGQFESAEQIDSSSSQWLIEQYQLQHSTQNSTKNYVCAPQQSLEALYVEQFRKMSRRQDTLASVPVAETNRFDVSSQLKLPDEETQTLDELVKAFRTRKLQRVAALRKNQIVSEQNFRTQCLSTFRRLKNRVVGKLHDTIAEFRFALEQFTLYSN